MTQGKETPFTIGIPGPSWLRWFRKRYPDLFVRLAQGLYTKRAHGLCAKNVTSFYENISCLYTKYEYSPSRTWNYDESGVQAGCNGGAYVLVRTRACNVHQVVPDKHKWLWLIDLTCFNVIGKSVLNFYIFCGKRFRRNYIHLCKQGATMAMSKKA